VTLLVLDSTPLGLLVHSRAQVRVPAEDWLSRLSRVFEIVVPEITFYEVRRELVRLGRDESTARLNVLAASTVYAELTTGIMIEASDLWAASRRAGRPTAGDRALDIDVLLAATALEISRSREQDATVATGNVRHLAQFVDARLWESIGP
jgi:predicted nucleic acid-binding protein